MRHLRVAPLGAALLLLAAPLRADTGYEGDDLSLRLASAFIGFTEVSTFGGETAANRWSPAVNPASAAWTRFDTRWRMVLAGYGSRIALDSGTDIDLLGETAVWQSPRAGAFHLAFSQLRSNDATDLQGVGFDYETDTAQLQWGLRSGCWAGGLTVNVASSEVVRRALGAEVARSTADTYRLRAGLLVEPRRRWLIGAVAEVGWSPFDFTALAVTPLGPLPVAGSDTQTQVIGRLGVSFEYCPLSTLYADLQVASYENDRGTLDVQRVVGGVQHRLLPFLFLRGALSVDGHGNVGTSVGLGLPFARWGSLDACWKQGTLPELEHDFGDADVFQVLLSFRF